MNIINFCTRFDLELINDELYFISSNEIVPPDAIQSMINLYLLELKKENAR